MVKSDVCSTGFQTATVPKCTDIEQKQQVTQAQVFITLPWQSHGRFSPSSPSQIPRRRCRELQKTQMDGKREQQSLNTTIISLYSHVPPTPKEPLIIQQGGKKVGEEFGVFYPLAPPRCKCTVIVTEKNNPVQLYSSFRLPTLKSQRWKLGNNWMV